MENNLSRRNFLQKGLVAVLAFHLSIRLRYLQQQKTGNEIGFGHYLWAKDWDLPTLITNCEKTGYLGVELRCDHKHGVETKLSASERADVKNVCRQRLTAWVMALILNIIVPIRLHSGRILIRPKNTSGFAKTLAPPE